MKEGFRLKFTKCKFAADSVRYLGHIIQNNTIRPVKDNLISIRHFPIPKTQKNIRQFLGKINFYYEYIPKSAIILDPLHNLLRKGQSFIWSDKCQNSFKTVKELLCSQPILKIFDRYLSINIYTDATLQGVGVILKQIQTDGKEKPVAYFSKKLNESQKRKKAIYLECLVIKEAVKYWQFWLIEKSFTVYSDHKPLENLNIKFRTDEDLGDLSYYLSQYDFKIKYAPRKENLEADCRSRNPVLEANENENEQLKIVSLIKVEDIIVDQEKKIILSERFCIGFIKNVHKHMCHIGINQIQKKLIHFIH